MATDRERARWARLWDRAAPGTDAVMRTLDRALFGDCREWVCRRATGRVLEIGVGTGLNLPHYPAGTEVVGIDLSPAMIGLAKERAAAIGSSAVLRVGDAEDLDLPDDSVDTVVCTFSLCGIPDHRRALAEMVRVVRPGGLVLLADHVVAGPPVLRAVQWLVERVSVPVLGENLRRRPLDDATALGLRIEERERFARGLVERGAARVP